MLEITDKEVELSKEVINDILKIGDSSFNKLVNEKYKSEELKENESKSNEKFLEFFRTVREILKDYLDIDERYYSIIAIWIIGTYFHQYFPTYPYLYFNAMKGSGKSRAIRLITYLSKDGEMLNSLTEAVLFRTKGTLGIDECEGFSRKGSEALKELLNSSYKKGIKIKRMKKIKTLTGEEQVPESFDVYRPILMANINGMDDVLNDRCITIILERSSNTLITRRMELFDFDEKIKGIKQFSLNQCSLCSVDVVNNVYIEWNKYIYTSNTLTQQTTYNTLTTQSFFNKIDKTNINGRSLELSLPLFIIASWLGEDILDEIINTFCSIVEEKKKEDSVENLDISLIDFVSQQLPNKWSSIKDIFTSFKSYVQMEGDWLNERWLGRALKRLSLTKEKRRMGYGISVLLNVEKAQQKIKMFKVE